MNDISIIQTFDKQFSNERKEQIKNYNKNLTLDNNEKNIPIYDFINKELIHFSYDNTFRTIPNIDGLKPSQRKILHTSFTTNKKGIWNEKDELRVSQLAGAVSAETAYHHGEMSLQNAIFGLG